MGHLGKNSSFVVHHFILDFQIPFHGYSPHTLPLMHRFTLTSLASTPLLPPCCRLVLLRDCRRLCLSHHRGRYDRRCYLHEAVHLVHASCPSIDVVYSFAYIATFAASRAAFTTSKPAAGNVPTSTFTIAAAAAANPDNATYHILSHLRFRH
jgi:hypothetical protein